MGLREKYDQVTAVYSFRIGDCFHILNSYIHYAPRFFFFQKREELRRELDVANEKLRRLNAENEYVYSHFYLFPL